jgi:hypothetical protein
VWGAVSNLRSISDIVRREMADKELIEEQAKGPQAEQPISWAGVISLAIVCASVVAIVWIVWG